MVRIKGLNIQNHKTLAKRYRAMARAYLRKQTNTEEAKKDNTYGDLIAKAEEHERKGSVFGKRRPPTFIFVRR